MKKEHFYAVLAICAVILALATIVRGQALSAVAPLLARLVWSSCGGTAGRDVSVSSYPHLPRHLISLLGSCPCPPSTRNANTNTKKDVVERNGKGDANGNAHRNSRIRCWKGHVQSFDVGPYVTPWEGHSVRPAHVPPEYR